jgi:ABC-type glycerol-3-phosphate transport system permease component
MKNYGKYIFLLAGLAVFGYPFLWMISASLKRSRYGRRISH